jgi:hypothetical protein
MNAFAGIQAQIGDTLRNGAAEAATYAERIIARLDRLIEAVETRDPEGERTTATAFLEPGTTERIVADRAGYMMTIEQVSIVTDGACIVDIHVGTEGAEGFRTRLETAAAGREAGGLVGYQVPENSPVFAIATGAGGARVNLQVKREKV